jgi:hypothetical protein
VRTSAALQAATRFAGPAVKFSIAGTRPIRCSASSTTATPAEFGRSTPTFSPATVSVANFWASTEVPSRSFE